MSWVERYHNRLHSTLGMVPPAEYEEAYWVGTLHSSSHLRGGLRERLRRVISSSAGAILRLATIG